MPHVIVNANGFTPSAMTKSAASSMGGANQWTVVAGWTADPAYPGSTVSDNGLRAQGSAAANVSAVLPFSGAAMSGNHQARLLVNNVVVATGPVATGTAGTMTVSANVSVSVDDLVTVETTHDVNGAGWQASITAGSGTYVRIS
ncbi:hypothetical protein IU459_01915 [Nocardia amamiensis]|uniref:Uncharacterized protein n=1 Tax=Nocardia amamiensis TaxID=404578 RepID=A0ABS0CKG7_9NOCA|nr:hypothetical protein [Nocardia amamiensis]MBF6296297.1 hypothetical protein [Nocardia amamiensis]